MKYVATVEIEFETAADPVEVLHEIMSIGNKVELCYAVHYHILEQPRELK